MAKQFVQPDFSTGEIELRVEGGEVLIYASEAGLHKLKWFCDQLLTRPKQGHIHVDDHMVLTDQSLGCVVAVFVK